MGNMSYCRFENTERDVLDCIGALEERSISSDSEKEYAESLLETVCKYLQDEGIKEDYDIGKIHKIIKECRER